MIFKSLAPYSVCVLLFSFLNLHTVNAQESAGIYSKEVIAQADKYLSDAGLRRSGKSILYAGQAVQMRNLQAISKQMVDIKKAQKELDTVAANKKAVDASFRELNRNLRDINVQLANPTIAFNRRQTLVATNNALVSQLKELESQKDDAQKLVDQARSKLQELESTFVGEVLNARENLDKSVVELAQSIKDKNVKTALTVLSKEFGTPESVDVATLFKSLENRIEDLESSFVSEPIPLIDDGGNTRKIAVVVNGKPPIEMVLDSGASIILLPKAAAIQLGINIAADAQEITLQVADGRSIPGRLVLLESVRVGKFEVRDVEAAILDIEQDDNEPLLGMSFLGNFQFQVKAAENELWLSEVKSNGK